METRLTVWLTETTGSVCSVLCEHRCYNYYLDILVCVFDSEILFLHFCYGGTEVNKRDTDGFVFAADANYRLSFVSIGIAGLGQVMSQDAVQATQSRILWYKYH